MTLDGYAASHRAVREMKADGLVPEDTKVRSSKYLNTLVEQDHRNIKSRTKVMLGFKPVRNAVIKGQFSLAKLRLNDTAAPAVWMAVLSA
ncbi:DDE-type integrase/transposase/recombinase [Paraburkholderia sediminicola]|uniref:DDE-type integrase/transposase/recombinase n=1 Tax=Paraburkholderia sediminicola TaxID=458836 RepID=UPI0038BC1215